MGQRTKKLTLSMRKLDEVAGEAGQLKGLVEKVAVEDRRAWPRMRGRVSREEKQQLGPFAVKAQRNKGLKESFEVRGNRQTCQNAEVVAVKTAAVITSNERVLHIKNSSPYVTKVLTACLAKMEDEGYVAIKKRKLIKATVVSLRKRSRKVVLKDSESNGTNNRHKGAPIINGARRKEG